MRLYETRVEFAIDRKMKYYQFLKLKVMEEDYETSNCKKTLSAGLGSGIVFSFVRPICFLVFYSLSGSDLLFLWLRTLIIIVLNERV